MQPAATNSTLTLIGIIAGWIIGIAIIGAGLWWWYSKSDDRRLLLIKWALSVPGILWLIHVMRFLRKSIDNASGADYGAAFYGAISTAAIGVYFAMIWRRNIAGLIANPFGSLYDGGNEPMKPQAYYSSAEAKRKRGHYAEAVADIQGQLDKFPHDFAGQMMLAEIQAHDLHDLPTAVITIQRICHQPKHTNGNIASALNTLADWHLKYSADPDAAREALEQLMALLPDTEFALLAEQRIAHLASRKHLAEQHDRPRVAIPKGADNVGLMASSAHLAPAPADQAARAGQLVEHLQTYPQDTEAREQLAIIYADHYRRLDLAADQLNQLINQPHQPVRNVIHWLNLLADLQIRLGSPYETVSGTLSQIIERYPNAAAANLARNRLDLLRLELKAHATPRSIKLGTYEQNIGLKQGSGSGEK
jgi:outer membrane protein assembly factor BamD (BamD/ComL family)